MCIVPGTQQSNICTIGPARICSAQGAQCGLIKQYSLYHAGIENMI